jgi:formylmethanofuran dehydrogenase subunit E
MEYYEIYNQQDDKVDCLEDIPYYEEIEFFPDFDITNYTTEELYYCEECGDPIRDEDEVYNGPHGEILCEYCFDRYYFYCNDCGEVFSNNDGYEGADGYMYCADCFGDRFFECQNCGGIFDIDELCYSEED